MFSFLPIHAAGLYNSDKDSAIISDYCVVSYTPSLAALLACQAQPIAARRGNVKVLLAAASEPFTSTAIPAAREETDIISHILSSGSFISSMVNGLPDFLPKCVSTADEVLKLLPETTILHLACHGLQNTRNPLESGFIMQDRMLKVADLIHLNLPQARLAFLSACETAQGDMERPDEALHIAATMLHVGFKSVVGTMWSMGDVDGPILGEIMYRKLFEGEGEVLDFEAVPYALDDAVKKLRELGLEPSRWAPYIHIGM
jgi:CHAT domain-containing protein